LENRQLLAAIQVTSSPGPKGSTNLTFVGTDGQNVLDLSLDATRQVVVRDLFGGSTFQLNGGPEVTQLTFAKLNNLSFDLGAGADGAFVNAPAGNITIQDGADGAFSNYRVANSVNSRVTKVGDIQATFLGGLAIFGVSSFPGSTGYVHSLQTGKLSLNLAGTIQSEVNLTADEGSQLLLGDVSITSPESSASQDSINLLAKSGLATIMGQISLGALSLNTGGGQDLVNSRGAVTYRGPVNAALGGGDDGFHVRSGSLTGTPRTESVATFQNTLNIDGGAGASSITLLSTVDYERIRFQGPVTIQTGDEADLIQVWRGNFAKDLTIQTGNTPAVRSVATDQVELSNIDVLGKTTVTAVGAGDVRIDSGSYFANEPSRYLKAAKFTLGSGAVTIGNLFGSQVQFGSTQAFTGVNSQMTVSYIGVIDANLSKRLLNNAILA
jgi:hypothetical protein